MAQPKYAKRTDLNQKTIVAELRKIPNLSILLDCDDILIGYKGFNYWYEIKNPDTAHNKAGKVKETSKQPSQKKLEKDWRGHWKIVSSLEEILKDMNII